MILSRRRFVTISAAFAAAPRAAAAQTWQGHAFGAEVSLTIRGPREVAAPALAQARAAMQRVEGLFSLYDPHSALSRLNAHGTLMAPDPDFLALMQAADHAHHVTAGLFDPSVQPLWAALARGADTANALAAIGWGRVDFSEQEVTLGTGQALTFNGIAQGFATDVVADVLASHGLSDVLVNIGEYRGHGGPWRLAVQDPIHGRLGMRSLTSGAIATSSPLATRLGTQGHILHRAAQPQWSTVSVEAPSATLADSLSTAMVLATRAEVEAMRAKADVTRVTLVDMEGNLATL